MHRSMAGLVMAVLAATAPAHGAQAPTAPQVPPVAAAARSSAPAHAPAPAPRKDNDPYEFATGDSVAQVIRLSRTAEGVRFTWPRTAAPWDTALLAVRSGGAEQDPWVEVSVGEFRIQQYLDANAVGVRWLNLSGLREQLVGGSEVVVRTHAVTLEAEAATLRLFDNHLDLQRRILVIAAHPDDAEIAAFGLYADRQATVVTVKIGRAHV